MSILEVKNLKKDFQLADNTDLKVLDGINCKFDRGDFVSILGESGGGKTTLMNIIAGLDSQYSGEVLFDGNNLRDMNEEQKNKYRRENIGFIFQSFNLISHLNVLDNVLVGLEMTNLPKEKKLSLAEDLLNKVGLKEKYRSYPNQLSGGQKQRVAIARALANDPDIIIADEPTGALDSGNTDEILKILDEIATEGKLVIAVTHSQTVAEYGTRIVHLENGILDRDERLKPAHNEKNQKVKYQSKKIGFAGTFTMALKHMRKNIGSNVLITFGGMIGIFSVLLMLALGNGIAGFINHEIAGNLNPTTVEVTHKPKEGDTAAVSMTNKDIKKIKDIAHVSHVEKALYVPSVQVKYRNKTVTTSYFQTQNRSFLKKNLISGHNADGLNEIVISKDIAKKYAKSNYQSMLGKTITFYMNTYDNQNHPIILSKPVKIVGFTKSANTATVSYNTVNKMAISANVKLKPSLLAVTVDKLSNVETVQNKVKKMNYQLTGVGSMLDTINNYVKLASYVLAGTAGISLLVSAIMIIVVLYIGVSSRTKEIGILRALGASQSDVRSLFFSESLIIGLLFSILGAVFAFIMTIIIDSASNGFVHYSIAQLTIGNVIFGISAGVIISLIAALAPSRKAAKLDPIVALNVE